MIAQVVAGFSRRIEGVAGRLQDLPLFDAVAALTLFLVVIFGFDDSAFRIVAQLALLGVLLHWPLLRNPALWATLAAVGTLILVQHWYAADNHKYLLVYWLWVITIASYLGPDAGARKVLLFNARFFLVFIFLGAALQKWLSSRYMSGEMFEMCLLLDGRFRAFSHLVGIDKSVADAALLKYTTLQSPLSEVVNNELLLPATDRSRFVAWAVTWYDLLVQIFIGTCLALNRRLTDRLAHVALLFFIFTTYLPAPVFGFGWTLVVLGLTLTKERFPRFALAYFGASAAVVLYQMPWREWVLG
jgi:hypothetical protein